MKALILALTMAAFAPAFAGNPKPAPKPKPVVTATPFSELADAWEKGAPLRFNDIDGVISGRCYERDAKNIMLPGLLIVQTFDAGPNFPKNSENYVARFTYGDKFATPDAFDFVVSDEQKKKLVELLPRLSRTHTMAKDDEKGLTYIEYFYVTLKPALKIEIRMSNGLPVLRSHALADVVINARASGEQKEFTAGEVTEYCYFFKQIIPKAEISKYR